jgi:transposase
MDLPLDAREQIIIFFNTGQFTYREIAAHMNISVSCVSKIIALWRETGSVKSRRFGRPSTKPRMPERTKRLILRQSEIDPRATARQLRERVGGDAAKFSVRTIRRCLQYGGRRAYRPIPSPILDAGRKRQRLIWARAHRHWTQQEWNKVW